MVCFHRYLLKDKVIREAHKKLGELQYQGKPISIYEDYSPEVMEQRAQYREIMVEMYKQGLKLALLYPARLRIMIKEGSSKWFTSVEEGKRSLNSQRGGSQ